MTPKQLEIIEDAIREAYSQGLSDGHPMGRSPLSRPGDIVAACFIELSNAQPPPNPLKGKKPRNLQPGEPYHELPPGLAIPSFCDDPPSHPTDC